MPEEVKSLGEMLDGMKDNRKEELDIVTEALRKLRARAEEIRTSEQNRRERMSNDQTSVKCNITDWAFEWKMIKHNLAAHLNKLSQVLRERQIELEVESFGQKVPLNFFLKHKNFRIILDETTTCVNMIGNEGQVYGYYLNPLGFREHFQGKISDWKELNEILKETINDAGEVNKAIYKMVYGKDFELEE